MKDKSKAITFLRLLGMALPGDWIKTWFYLNVVVKPRRLLRMAIHRFYRMDHVYEVLTEARDRYGGSLSVLEFGTNEGYSFRKILYATRYLGIENRVQCHGFDSFEGMPAPRDRSDLNLVTNRAAWSEGQYRGAYEELLEYCRRYYPNAHLYKGLFEDTLHKEFLQRLLHHLPILVWIDCDFYSSARTVVERLIPYLPTGCVVYFDEFEFNYGSRFTGEARVVYELNSGCYGNDIELVLDSKLSLDSRRVYRFVRFKGGPHYQLVKEPNIDYGRSPTNDSPLP